MIDDLEKNGVIYLIPTPIGENSPQEVIPFFVKNKIENLNHFVVENEKKARRFIKKILPNKNKSDLNRYIIFGHTDTKGTIKYNMSLSIKRAEAVKEILLSLGITAKNVSVLGKGENQLAVDTPDNKKHPTNRRVEIKILN